MAKIRKNKTKGDKRKKPVKDFSKGKVVFDNSAINKEDIAKTKIGISKDSAIDINIGNKPHTTVNPDILHFINMPNDHYPIALFPVKIETKFVGDSLRIRVFPDDIFIDSFESTLTKDEVEYAKLFWKKLYDIDKKTIEEKKASERKIVFNDLLNNFDEQRAAWIFKKTKALLEDSIRSWDKLSDKKFFKGKPDTNVIDELSDNKNEDELFFKANLNILPDYFAFKLYDENGNPYPTIYGNSIPDTLPINFDNKGNDNWLFNFDKAVAIGMAIEIKKIGKKKKLPISFSKIVVYGVKYSLDIDASKEKLQDLFEHHTYSPGGMGFASIGKPTKAVENPDLEKKEDKSLDSFIRRHIIAKKLASDTDGIRFSDALGLDSSYFKSLENADDSSIKSAFEMNKSLWPATMGFYIDEFFNLSKQKKESTKTFFSKHLSGRGTIPSIRIDEQAYGVLPMSVFSKWKPKKQPTFGDTIINKYLNPIYKNVYKKIANEANSTGSKDSIDTLKELSEHASSNTFYVRGVYNATDSNISRDNAIRKFFIWQEYSLKSIGINNPKNVMGNRYFLQNYNNEYGPHINDGGDPVTKLTEPIIDEGEIYNTRKIITVDTDTPNYLQNIGSSDSIDILNETDEKSLLYRMLRYAYLRELNKVVRRLEEKGAYYEVIKQIIKEVKNNKQLIANDYGIKYVLSPKKTTLYTYEKIIKSIDLFKIKGRGEIFISNLKNPIGDIISHSTKIKHLYKKALSKNTHNKLTQENLKLDSRNSYRSKKSMNDYIEWDLTKNKASNTKELKELKDAINYLKDLDVQQLAYLFSEHIDINSHRIDSWLLGVVDERLHKLRKDGDAKGCYIGAYGFVENLNKATDKKNKIKADYIHAPSLDQAKTAAIIKSNIDKHTINYDIYEFIKKAQKKINANTIKKCRIKKPIYNLKGNTATYSKDVFDYYSFLCLLTEINKSNYFNELYNLFPDVKKAFEDVWIDDVFNKLEAIIFALTPSEMFNPETIITTDRIKEIAYGSGNTEKKVSAFIQMYKLMQKVLQMDIANISINIDAKRTKTALKYIAGIQNGQSMNSLLGYEFERALSDNELSKYVLNFRTEFGTVSSNLVSQNNEINEFEANTVVDGLKIIKEYQTNNYQLKDISFIEDNDKETVKNIIKQIDHSLDGLSDLLHVEAIFQIVKGNTDRLGGLFNSLKNFENIPKPQFQDTQMPGLKHENKVVYTFSKKGKSVVWGKNATIKSTINPWLNEWLGDILPSLKDIKVEVTIDENSGNKTTETISLADIYTSQPIDFVMAFPNRLEERHFIEIKIKRHIENVSKTEIDWNTSSINYGYSLNDSTSFNDLSLLIQQIKKVLISSHILKAEDLADKETTNITLVPLVKKLEGSIDDISKIITNINDLLNNKKYNLLYEKLIDNYILLNDLGLPDFDYANNTETHDKINLFANNQIKLVEKRIDEIKAKLKSLDKDKIDYESVHNLLSSVMSDASFISIPFSMNKNDSIYQTQEFSNTKGFNINDWVYEASKVNESLNDIVLLNQISELLNKSIFADTPPIRQFPYKNNIDKNGNPIAEWAGTEMSYTNEDSLTTCSYVFLNNLNIDNNTICGLLISEWDEIIPFKKVDSGVAFNYDLPNSQSPKNIILGISPTIEGHWYRDDILGIVNETIEMSKIRSVNFEDIQKTVLGDLLPTTIAPVYEEKNELSFNFLKDK